MDKCKDCKYPLCLPDCPHYYSYNNDSDEEDTRHQFEDDECYGCQLSSCIDCPWADLDDEPED